MDLLKSLVFDWQNAIFTAAIVFWLIYLFFVMHSSVSDTEIGPDISHDMDHDIDHDIDHDMDPDLDHDADHDVDHAFSTQHPILDNVLSFLGVGRCPLSIILMVFGISWGFIGLCANSIFSRLQRSCLISNT